MSELPHLMLPSRSGRIRTNPSCPAPASSNSITFSSSFKKTKHVFDAFSFRGNQIGAQARREVLTFGCRDATAKAGCAFRERYCQT